MIDRQVSIIVSLTDWEALKKRQVAERWVPSQLSAVSTEKVYKDALWWQL